MGTVTVSPENNFLAFAKFFKSYMGIMPIVAAALAPVLTATNVIPTYASQKGQFAAMAGVFGFLLVALVFYWRRTIALGSMRRGRRWFFNFFPIGLVLGAIFCFVGYTSALDQSIEKAQKEATQTSSNKPLKRADVLGDWSKDHAVPGAIQLQLLFMGMVLFPETAFAMMALREYARSVLGITEQDWMFGDQPGSPGIATLEPSLVPPGGRVEESGRDGSL